MNILFRAGGCSNATLRMRLLEKSLRSYLKKNAQRLSATISDIDEDDRGISTLEALSALPSAKNAELSVFVGLGNAPESMLGRNLLVCTRPLTEELEDFAARHAGNMDGSPNWARNLLANFDSVILLSRHDFRRSSGFARWVPVILSGRFPVILERPARRCALRAVILQHDPKTGAKAAADLVAALSPLCDLRLVPAPDGEPGAEQDILDADIHVHVGYRDIGKPTAITPFDSLAAGYYTSILLSSSQSRVDLGHALEHEAALRTYVDIADTVEMAVASCSNMIRRLGAMQSQGFHVNPELGRFARLNENYLSACQKRFEEQLGRC